MSNNIITTEFYKLTANLIGFPVSLTWKGYGSAIFLELGELQYPEPNSRNPEGQAHILIEWDWRLEDNDHVVVGSSNSGPDIEEQIKILEGSKIAGIELVGNIPEIVVYFTNNMVLRSMVMHDDDPQWGIKLPNGEYVGPKVLADDEMDLYYEDESAFIDIDLAEKIAERWDTPEATPIKGHCRDCAWYVRIDGDYYLLDYGVCTNSESPLDGKAVNCKSGCPAFTD